MSARPRILLTHTPDARANYYGAQALAGLRILGDVALHEQADPLHGAALIQAAAVCSLVIADRNTAFPAAVLAAMTDTAAVLRCAVDISNIDVTAASANGILVTQAGRSWIASVAELTIGLMIDAARGISRANAAYKSGQTAIAAMGTQLEGSVAGLVGYGPLGRRVGELCRALGMQVLVADPYVTEVDGSVMHVALGDLLRRSDFVLVLAAATPETENLIDAATLGAMKPSAVLINVARGNLVDESALADALDAGRIAGAAMDVGRAADQMPSLGLAHRPDVSATPHIAGQTRPAIEGQALETVRQAAEIVHGRAPRGSVNAEHARRLSRIS